ncbi:hypothetical protein HRR83_002992 [Exophiala dermatitidis]|uniref:Wings apart-like protein C-terminal domain-containing protein n=2 Tax=Exophiala dermatitidis TaxID=5970 RepID=H6BYD5_EXODN|nr:uncharacterized protein HMPREF1120_05547 [Exophiala dermatitidis NIH/UT8656]KAJ4506784.1 hypothetical protein HRR73_007999 [Exophiala dermatitidis]EHY57515.1 hypothetical protein HMPREF1120_05547 [Exophiala dermatitidis NIH/UT8656]KAJ4516618.1 hypothetical protein HRR75_003275 [Exophiala dermatitidis]KAJ4520577.1 hypothetical protein HRR74_003575 [Exophiala dermatitidis]KAJ4537784.1 hypothetical protein HRR76_005770 [Exophiala dermatitidis]
MEFPGARRKLNTYGKANRKILVHDIFGIGNESSQSTTASSTLSSLGQPQPRSSHALTPRVKRDTVATSTTRYILGGFEEKSNVVTTSTNTSARSSSREKSPSALFEIQTSDDDSSRPQGAKRPLKKRKAGSTMTIPTVGTSLKTLDKGSLFRTQSGDHNRVARKQGEADEVLRGQAIPLEASPAPKPKSQISKMKPTVKASAPTPGKPLTTRGAPSGSLAMSKKAANKGLRVGSDSSAQVSDDLSTNLVSRQSTPKRRRLASEDGSIDSPSPSDLQMTALRLTSDAHPQDLQISSDDEEMADVDQTSYPSVRTRKRLVDRLDAPTSRTPAKSASKSSLQSKRTPKQASSQPVSGTSSPGRAGAVPPLVRAETAPLGKPNIAPLGRPRATYARQRSYLSDMVDSLESHATSLSQPSSQQDYFSQRSFTDLGSQMDFVNEDSDDDDFAQIKSIHELRRGGAITKFDLDLQTIVEDIEADSKSLRIQALMQLNSKLVDSTFCRHFQDSGIFVRFLDCARDKLDDVSATLMALILQKMSSAESSSPKSCLLIWNALARLPLRLISESRSLSHVARDRSQNLSKSLVRDVVDFDQKLAENEERSSSVQAIFVRSLDSLLRSLVRQQEAIPQLPRALLDAVVRTLVKSEAELQRHKEVEARSETVQQSLSILEIASSNHQSLESGLSSARIAELGDAMASILRRTRQSQPLLEQSCLRLVVTLSNDEPKVCQAFTTQQLITTVFAAVEDRFSTLAGLAAREEEYDAAQLDSVILALGCLLNLTEGADTAREQMLCEDTSGKSLVDRLVDIFNSHVDQTSEAMTMQQTHVLVAFGYIAALLCTLCLNTKARQRISQTITGKGLSELFTQADTFLQHLQTVEAALAKDGGSPSGFTNRFTMVLETIKHDEMT